MMAPCVMVALPGHMKYDSTIGFLLNTRLEIPLVQCLRNTSNILTYRSIIFFPLNVNFTDLGGQVFKQLNFVFVYSKQALPIFGSLP